MKTRILLSLVMLLALNIFAQIESKDVYMSKGEQNAFITVLKNTNKKQVANVWKDYSKPFGKSKYDKKSEENIINEVSKLTSLGSNVNIYAKFVEVGSDIVLYSYFEADGAFVEEESKIEDFIMNFSYEVERKNIGDLLEKENDKLGDYQKEQKKLIKKKEKMEKEIVEAEKTIKDNKVEIEQNLKDQAKKESEIKEQISRVDLVKKQLEEIGKD